MFVRWFCILACCFVFCLNGFSESRVAGIWLGTLDAGGTKLRIQLNVSMDADGKPHGSLDSLDQNATGIPCDNFQISGDQFSFTVPAVQGKWSGTLSKDGNELNGTWSQGGALPLVLRRQAKALAPDPAKAPKYDAAVAPVKVADLKAVLDKDLAQALSNGMLAHATGGGMVVGVVQHGVRKFFVYGTAKEDSIFEIGSITKTFTGLILARMVEEHKVKFDEPVRDLLPDGTVAKPDGAEITLLDLATQHSGLPRMPNNFHPANPEDPYADYLAANLYEFIGKHGVAKPANPPFGYSNLGLGLLGQALANRAKTTYPELLHEQITKPLNLRDTVVDLSPEQEKRFIPGHTPDHRVAHPWKLVALAGAGAIRSTAADMLTYLEAELHPDRSPFASALKVSQELRAEVSPAMKIGLAWLYVDKTGNYWHNGGTGGYSSYAFFNPKDDTAAIVLFNTTVGNGFADRVGEHISERLRGDEAISLGE